MKLTSNNTIGLAALLLICIGLLTEDQISIPSNKEITEDFSLAVEAKLEKLHKLLDVADNNSDILEGENFNPGQANLWNSDGFSLFHYKNDTLHLWSDHTVPLASTLASVNNLQGLIRLENGWYYATNNSKDKETWVGLVKLKSEYPFENRFLINER